MNPRYRRYLPQTVLALGLLAVLIVGAVGMARGANPVKPASQPAAVLRWANEGVSDLPSLDPAEGPDFNTRLAAQLIYGGLVRFGPGFAIVPDVAERYTVSKDGRTYTFYLRHNVRFGDGSILTAPDVTYSLNRTLNPVFKNNSGPYFLSGIEGAPEVTAGKRIEASGIQAVGGDIVRIRLRVPDGSFLAKLATPAGYIVSPEAIAADGKTWDRHAFGTGPFRVKRWVANSQLLLVPNPHYYGGKVHVTGIDMPFIPEPLEAYKRYQAGALDTMGNAAFPTAELYNVTGQPDFHTSTRLETVFLTLNERHPPLNNVKVRQALARALDRQALVRDVYTNFAHPAFGMVPPGLDGYSATIPSTRHDLAAARRLLAQAGYPNGRGLPPITYTVDQDVQALALASSIAAQWRQLGIQVRLKQLNHTQYNVALSRLDFQIAVIDWTADYPDPENFLSQQLHTGVANNNSGWSNPTFDRLVDRADRLPRTSALRARLYRQADRLAMQQAANIPLVYPQRGILLRPGVHGLEFNDGQLLARDWTRVTVSQGRTQ